MHRPMHLPLHTWVNGTHGTGNYTAPDAAAPLSIEHPDLVCTVLVFGLSFPTRGELLQYYYLDSRIFFAWGDASNRLSHCHDPPPPPSPSPYMYEIGGHRRLFFNCFPIHVIARTQYATNPNPNPNTNPLALNTQLNPLFPQYATHLLQKRTVFMLLARLFSLTGVPTNHVTPLKAHPHFRTTKPSSCATLTCSTCRG
jgi:hypothetical protein